eukprot:5707565-Pleurochrysis_carterae.AAC.2
MRNSKEIGHTMKAKGTAAPARLLADAVGAARTPLKLSAQRGAARLWPFSTRLWPWSMNGCDDAETSDALPFK